MTVEANSNNGEATTGEAKGQTTTENGNGQSSVDVDALQKQLSDLKRKAWENETRAQTLEEKYKGIDPERYKSLVEDYDNLRKNSAVGDKDAIDSLIAEKESEFKNQYGEKIEGLEGKLSEAEKRIAYYEVVLPMREIGKDFLPEAWKYLDSEISTHCRKKDGQIVVYDNDGNVRMSKENPRIQMTPEEYIEELKEKNSFMVRPDVKSGAYTNTGENTTNGSGGNRFEAYKKSSLAERRQNFTPEERRMFSARSLNEPISK